MYCRNCGSPVDSNAGICANCGVPIGIGQSFCPNCGSGTEMGAAVCSWCGFGLGAVPAAGGQKSKLAAGLLGIFLGGYGVHNFYLGKTSRALIQLLVTLGAIVCSFLIGIVTIFIPFLIILLLPMPLISMGMGIWGLVEGIMILTGSINTDGKGVPLKD